MIFRCTKPITTNDILQLAVAQARDGHRVRVRAHAARWRSASTRAASSRAPTRALDAPRRPVPRRDAVVGHGRIAGARVFRVHDVGVPAAAGVARSCAVQVARPARAHRRCSPTTCRPNRTARRSSPASGSRERSRRRARSRPYVAGEYRPGPEATSDDASARIREEHRAARSSIRPARARWGRRRIRWRSSITSCACTASTASASSIAASCRRWSPATPTRRS